MMMWLILNLGEQKTNGFNKMRLDNLREDYTQGELGDVYYPKTPMVIFNEWMEDAINPNKSLIGKLKNWIISKVVGTLIEPNAMTLSTVDEYGNPNSRTVLLKGIDGETIQFFTNYDSKKGQEIKNNNNVSCVFWWPPLQRQVIIRGEVTQLSDKVNDNYYNSRPRKSQIGAHVSKQSTEIESRKELESRYFEKLGEFHNVKTKDIPRPEHWGGYGIDINSIEFWQGRSGRLHDRIRYNKNENGEWEWKRVSP